MTRTIRQQTREERTLPGGRRIVLEFRAEGESIPAILLLPDTEGPHPVALLLHGYMGRKEWMADSIGLALLEHGVASLAIDLPLHGERGAPMDAMSVGNPLELARRWRAALDESSLALRYLTARRELDRARLSLVGYSMGSFLGVAVAARDSLVRAAVLAAGGDLPSGTPFSGLVRTIADPLRAVRKLSGRPLLMVHGRWDRTILPEQAERLYAAAGEPKELRWWDAGHVLPPAAIASAAEWLAQHLDAIRRQKSG
ncbi:MAG: alpha/beta hydrolase [Chloroflexota bacterium]|nr:alpha/beta hydrolase [Chloroflexota bacterium]